MGEAIRRGKETPPAAPPPTPRSRTLPKRRRPVRLAPRCPPRPAVWPRGGAPHGPHTPRPDIRPRRGPEAREELSGPQSNRKPKPTRFKSKSSRQLARLPRRQAPRVADEGRAQGWACGGPWRPHARLQTRVRARAARVRPDRTGGAREGLSSARCPGSPGFPPPRPGRPFPAARSQPPGARAQGAAKVSEGRGKFGARGRAPTSCGERGQQRQAEQGRQERRHACPPAARCARWRPPAPGRRGSGARARAGRSHGRRLPAAWRAGGAGHPRPPGPARSSAALAPAPRAPALPPAAEALVRRGRPRAPPPPAGPAPRGRPADPSAPPALAGRAPARSAPAPRPLRPDLRPEPGSSGVRGPRLGDQASGAGSRDYFLFESFQRQKVWFRAAEGSGLTVAQRGDNWRRFASQ